MNKLMGYYDFVFADRASTQSIILVVIRLSLSAI